MKTLQKLDGVFESVRHSEMNYRFQVKIEGELEILNQRRFAINREAAENLTAIKEYIKSNFPLPAGFTVHDVGFDYTHVTVKAYTEAMSLKVEPTFPQKVKKISALEALKNHPNFVQILNSGVLSRDEKRKVLGLPKEKQGA